MITGGKVWGFIQPLGQVGRRGTLGPGGITLREAGRWEKGLSLGGQMLRIWWPSPSQELVKLQRLCWRCSAVWIRLGSFLRSVQSGTSEANLRRFNLSFFVIDPKVHLLLFFSACVFPPRMNWPFRLGRWWNRWGSSAPRWCWPTPSKDINVDAVVF